MKPPEKKAPVRRYFAGEPLSPQEWTDILESDELRQEFNERAAPLSDVAANELITRQVLARIEPRRPVWTYILASSVGLAAVASIGLLVATREPDDDAFGYRVKGDGEKGLPFEIQCIPDGATRPDQVIKSAKDIVSCSAGSELGATAQVPSAEWQDVYLVILQANPGRATVMAMKAGRPGALSFDPGAFATGQIRVGLGETLAFLIASRGLDAGDGEAKVRTAAQAALKRPLSEVKTLDLEGVAQTRISIQAGSP